MFTGIIEATGQIVERSNSSDILQLTITCPDNWQLSIGQSIAVNGACLTVVECMPGKFKAEVMGETIKRTTLGDSSKKFVNLERAMPATGRFEGHVVQGHVDVCGRLESITEAEASSIWEFTYPAQYQQYVVEKGSIAIDGVSLTVVRVGEGSLTVGLIPHTRTVTTFGNMCVGDAVNVEFDIMGKYYLNKLTHHG